MKLKTKIDTNKESHNILVIYWDNLATNKKNIKATPFLLFDLKQETRIQNIKIQKED